MRSEKDQSWTSVGFVKGAGNSAEPNSYTFIDRNLNSGKYNYRLKQIDFNGNFKFYDLSNEVVIGVPNKFSLHQNYPNPFNPVTKIRYDIPVSGNVSMKIYDNIGREVKSIINEFKDAGFYTVEFNGSNFASGIYYYKLETGNFTATKKMVLLK
ncbi:MAG: T9SS type A sorting domain-containing protein [Ignavibacteria bacterium]|nr:T9SS type A sorting domain-containing protein [Ignavibacteria bacterium]